VIPYRTRASCYTAKYERTLKRQGYRVLICAMNDGGYSSEFHELRADGIDDHLAAFARPPLENVAWGLGLRAQEVRDLWVIQKLFTDFAAQGETELWKNQTWDQVTAPAIHHRIQLALSGGTPAFKSPSR